MLRLLLACLTVLAAFCAVAGAAEPGDPTTAPDQQASAPAYEPVVWHKSRAVGMPWRGRLARGVRLPAEGQDFFTWDPVLEAAPSRPWRRWGTDKLVRTLLDVLREHRAAYPDAPRVGIGDLSRTRGGSFGERYGGLGHKSHQNGLDVDIYYPRIDRLEEEPTRVMQIDREPAQDLVDRFVDAGAQYVFVGPRTKLSGPRGIVGPLRFHNDHMHVRVYPPRR